MVRWFVCEFIMYTHYGGVDTIFAWRSYQSPWVWIHSCFPFALFMQCSEEDFQLDVKSLFVMLRCSARFDEYMSNLSDDSATAAMKEALDALNSDDPLNSEEAETCQLLSVGACLIVSIILQWTIRHLCKTLMQVMTPEALITFRNYIPSSYIRHYLEHQEHFSLEKLIAMQYNSVQATKRYVIRISLTYVRSAYIHMYVRIYIRTCLYESYFCFSIQKFLHSAIYQNNCVLSNINTHCRPFFCANKTIPCKCVCWSKISHPWLSQCEHIECVHISFWKKLFR